jgi:SAM-dependent methyltransferase
MNETTVRALAAINRAFYREAAEEFSATREAPWPGWVRLLAVIGAHIPAGELDILDLGCGNGRFAAFLAERVAEFDYLGIDASPRLLAAARARRLPAGSAEYRCADFIETPLEDCLPAKAFSLIVLFGVLHHIPGQERRRRLLRAAAGRLRPGGLLALTSWQFEVFRRFRDKLLPWEEFNRSAREPIDLAQLEPGDHLVPWGEQGVAFRYCHFTDEDETRRLLEELPLARVASYLADGREEKLNRYFVLRAGA